MQMISRMISLMRHLQMIARNNTHLKLRDDGSLGHGFKGPFLSFG